MNLFVVVHSTHILMHPRVHRAHQLKSAARDQGWATCSPRAKSGPGAEVFWPEERFRIQKGSDFEVGSTVINEYCKFVYGWPASCLTRRA